MQPEAKFARALDEKLKKIPNSQWFTIQQRSLVGHPDRFGVIAGSFVALELKRSRSAEKAKIQAYYLSRINDCGGYAQFCYPENEGRILDDLLGISRGTFDWTRYRQTLSKTRKDI